MPHRTMQCSAGSLPYPGGGGGRLGASLGASLGTAAAAAASAATLIKTSGGSNWKRRSCVGKQVRDEKSLIIFCQHQ